MDKDEDLGGVCCDINIIEMEYNIRKGRSWSISKDVVGCAKSVVGKKKFLFKF